jgi:IS30 family transposase
MWLGTEYFGPLKHRELWRRWRAGEAFSEIGRAMGCSRAMVHYTVMARGGFPPHPRLRREGTLELIEREEISRGLAQGCSLRHIAGTLGRAPSTISREIARNGGPRRYRAFVAYMRALQRALRPKECLLARHERLRQVVSEKLRQSWSPEQISGWLVREFVNDKSMRVSTETIYRSLFIQARGVLKQHLRDHLRSRARMRRPRAALARRVAPQGQILDAISIHQRPAEVEDRAVPGHWEGDLLIGSPSTQIATLVERQSRFVLLVKLDNRESSTVVQALSAQMLKLPKLLRGSLTWDRGREMSQHRTFTLATDLKVYFCDPSSPWQRGSNENTNGLLRQYFPKGGDLQCYTQEQLDAVALELNQRPRKTLGFATPADKLDQVLR